ncbi:MAG: hypothetical protein HQK49_22660 [Oligoflexia bacterium]|nr:hypothetical protein [Oligoflexia bacterium]
MNIVGEITNSKVIEKILTVLNLENDKQSNDDLNNRVDITNSHMLISIVAINDTSERNSSDPPF